MERELEDLDEHPPAASDSRAETAAQLVDRYISSRPAVAVTDILQYWRTEGGKLFPHLMEVARFAHSLPASSASSERLFSSAGRTAEPRRSNLSKDHLDQLLLVKGNKDLLKR
ncbi:uncharacterized protein LOC122387337 [Amphibalanus amphitrite]|uniref:uncharacterized protein LOC122387337 n=1 Tax=Amphibalanus amphitrite TaxID=1232801 RepID=UPI001C9081BE|nr:uncharacterized protein LOC122387337 [Amphibalanus amphitrite]